MNNGMPKKTCAGARVGSWAIALTLTIAAPAAYAQSGAGSKIIGVTSTGTSDGTPIRITLVPNLGARPSVPGPGCDILGGTDIGTASNCEFPHGGVAPAPFDGVMSFANLHPVAGQQGCVGPTDKGPTANDLARQLNLNLNAALAPANAFLNLSFPAIGQIQIDHIGILTPVGQPNSAVQWDLCVNGIKVVSQTPLVAPLDTTCSPVYPGTPVFATVPTPPATFNGCTFVGIKKGKHAVPALSMAGAIAVSALMLAVGALMLRQNRKRRLSA